MAEIDREKVIKGLECCIIADDDYYPECEKCPYRDTDGDTCDTMRPLFSDALAMLKAQEPRVMTLEEALDCNYCWFETHNWKNGDHFVPVLRALAMDDDSGRTFIDQNDDLFGFRDEEYGKTVRCWTARPTEEQREAVKWE